MSLPGAKHALGEREKNNEDLLSTTNPGGQDKGGAFFTGFGFTVDAREDFAQVLKSKQANSEFLRLHIQVPVLDFTRIELCRRLTSAIRE